LVERGLALHEARRYTAALGCFERALRSAPGCPVAVYDKANTLHMLDRNREAEALLRGLIAASQEDLEEACDGVEARSLQLDAWYLLFEVMIDGRGFSAGAFWCADEHLRRRRRGVKSLWSVRQVRARVRELRQDWLADRLPSQSDACLLGRQRPDRRDRVG
jgi:hypothetical protein